MNQTMSKSLLIGFLLLGAFGETLWLLSSQRTFSSLHFEADSERLLVIGPAIILMWLGRHILPPTD